MTIEINFVAHSIICSCTLVQSIHTLKIIGMDEYGNLKLGCIECGKHLINMRKEKE